MKQPRDKNGRFRSKAGETTRVNPTKEIIIFVGILLVLLCGGFIGYTNGYQAGLSANQLTIYQNGFNAGMTQQKNIDELARNWTVLGWRTSVGSVEYMYYRNDNPNHVKIVYDDYSTELK